MYNVLLQNSRVQQKGPSVERKGGETGHEAGGSFFISLNLPNKMTQDSLESKTSQIIWLKVNEVGGYIVRKIATHQTPRFWRLPGLTFLKTFPTKSKSPSDLRKRLSSRLRLQLLHGDIIYVLAHNSVCNFPHLYQVVFCGATHNPRVIGVPAEV